MTDQTRFMPVSDWEKSKVIVVDPGIWKKYRKPDCDLRPVYRDLRAVLDVLGVENQILTHKDSPVDIWIRDWGFVEGCYFQFEPSYAIGAYPPASVAKARRMLDQRLGCCRPTLSLVLDGGNLIHNGRTAILTEKVLRDNRAKSRAEVERTILDLGFEHVVFIPIEPDDSIGHADGILRFISGDVLVVNDYTGNHFTGYRKRLMRILENAGIGARIVPFPWFSTAEKRGGIWSAAGAYINFILTRHGIAYPTFNHPLDEQVARVLAENTALPLRPVFASPLAAEGGVLNCMSLNVTR
jgi:agmatine/peptidylarginine deiminase